MEDIGCESGVASCPGLRSNAGYQPAVVAAARAATLLARATLAQDSLNVAARGMQARDACETAGWQPAFRHVLGIVAEVEDFPDETPAFRANIAQPKR